MNDNQQKIANINDMFDSLELDEQDELILSIYQRTEKKRLQQSIDLAQQAATIKKSVFSLRDKLKNPTPIRNVRKKSKVVPSAGLFETSIGEGTVRPLEASAITDGQPVPSPVGKAGEKKETATEATE